MTLGEREEEGGGGKEKGKNEFEEYYVIEE